MMALSEVNEILARKSLWVYCEDGLFYWYTLFGLNDIEADRGGPYISAEQAFLYAIQKLPYSEQIEILQRPHRMAYEETEEE